MTVGSHMLRALDDGATCNIFRNISIFISSYVLVHLRHRVRQYTVARYRWLLPAKRGATERRRTIDSPLVPCSPRCCHSLLT